MKISVAVCWLSSTPTVCQSGALRGSFQWRRCVYSDAATGCTSQRRRHSEYVLVNIQNDLTQFDFNGNNCSCIHSSLSLFFSYNQFRTLVRFTQEFVIEAFNVLTIAEVCWWLPQDQSPLAEVWISRRDTDHHCCWFMFRRFLCEVSGVGTADVPVYSFHFTISTSQYMKYCDSF